MKDNPFNLTPEQLEKARRPVVRNTHKSVEEFCKETERCKYGGVDRREKTRRRSN
jgi:hypothetical protein